MDRATYLQNQIFEIVSIQLEMCLKAYLSSQEPEKMVLMLGYSKHLAQLQIVDALRRINGPDMSPAQPATDAGATRLAAIDAATSIEKPVELPSLAVQENPRLPKDPMPV